MLFQNGIFGLPGGPLKRCIFSAQTYLVSHKKRSLRARILNFESEFAHFQHRFSTEKSMFLAAAEWPSKVSPESPGGC